MTDPYHARLDWDPQGQPISQQFDDVYFSRANGLEETRHVFLRGNRLAERLAALPEQGCLTIGETGFGTGLNFLCAWQLFDEVAPASARLHFISVEKYPLSLTDLQRALDLWPELQNQAEALIRAYRAIHPGFQQLVFDDGRITLTLLVGDVHEQLPELEAQVDAWFLDGFAPAKNPQMWSEALFSQLARLSAPGATLGTFTSAGFVRRGLQAAGFAMQRVPGYGRKREILQGQLETPVTTQTPAWYQYPLPATARQAVIIGAGLAGCATASSLARRGWQVTVLDQQPEPAQAGSGNPQGVLYLKLSAHGTELSRLIVSGFGHSRRLLQDLPQGHDWQPCGVLQMGFDSRETKRQQQLADAFPDGLLQLLDREAASRQAGIDLPHGGLFFPEAGWLHPPALCRQLLQHPNIRFLGNQAVSDLQHENGQWTLRDAEGQPILNSPVVVVASAEQSRDFEPLTWLPLKRIRGQISRLPQTTRSQALQTVVCAEGYLAPSRDGSHTLGATFNFTADHLQPTREEHQENLQMLAEMVPGLMADWAEVTAHPEGLDGRAAYRCTSPDYLPLVGPVADADAFSQRYAMLRKDARQQPDLDCPWLPGLYLNTGHGSRGLITAPLSGELLAAWLNHEPLPLPRKVAEACHPNRFLLRQLIRGR